VHFGSWRASYQTRSKSGVPAHDRRVAPALLRAGSGNRALPATAGASRRSSLPAPAFFAIARRQAVTARLNGSVGASSMVQKIDSRRNHA